MLFSSAPLVNNAPFTLEDMRRAIDAQTEALNRPPQPDVILVSGREYAAMCALPGGPSIENYMRIHGLDPDRL